MTDAALVHSCFKDGTINKKCERTLYLPSLCRDCSNLLISTSTIQCALSCKDNPYFKDAGPLVKTNVGSIVGKYVKVFDTDVAAFLGIPYAKPPIGEKRFSKPEPIDPWDGILLADEKPSPCMQYSSRNFSFIPTTKPSEDCLYLNIWTPMKCCCGSHDKFPVLVWIYGGGFSFGSTDIDLYDGRILASYGEAIVVSMNYRVGVFGFLDAGTKDSQANAGLFDQSLALKWVKENIQHFGGDPNSITIFGESAGAISVSLHMISPISKNLFNRAIIQSGSSYNPHIIDSPSVAQFKVNTLAQMIDCANDTHNIATNPSAVVHCLKKKDAMALAKTENTITSKTVTFSTPSFGNDFLPKSPLESFKSGEISPVDVLIGNMKDEGTLFLYYMMSEVFPIDQTPLVNLSQAHSIISVFFRMVPESMVEKIFNFYFREISEEDTEKIIKAFSDALGDYVFNCPMMYLAEKMKNVYFYEMTHRSQRDILPEWMGVPHFYDVPFVFGMPIVDTKHFTPEDGRFSGDLIQKWTSFARTGCPLSNKQSWPKFYSTNPTVFEMNSRNSHIKSFSRIQACEFWRPLLTES
ncbi:acetylcholinesterase [Trichonephila clavipes]|nr:acetylcholinesterase [Trichonephila clavipes]